jgi:signal transduction histidine kinase
MLALWLCTGLLSQAAAQVHRLTEMKAMLMPSRSAAHTTVETLPYRWDAHFPGENGAAVFSAPLPKALTPSDTQLLAVYAPKMGNQWQMYINGQLIGEQGQLDNPWFDASQIPLCVTFPASLLHSNEANTLEIRVSFQALRWGGISDVYVGPLAEVSAIDRWSHWWQQTSYVVILIALMLMGLISWFIWLKQREGLYGLFALSAFWGGVSAVDHLMPSPWLPWPLQGIVAAVALAWHVIFMSRFAMGIAGYKQPWVRLASLAIMLAIGIAYVLAEPVYWTIAFGFLCLPVAAALYFTAHVADSEKSGQARSLFFVSLVVALTALRDFFIVHWPESGMNHYALLPQALFLFTLMMAWILVKRYTEQHRLYHELNINLEDRVSEREQQLAASFERLKSQGEERAKLLERQRIMSDIHDGVGGQLVSLVNMIKRLKIQKNEAQDSQFNPDQLQEHAQMALDELRVAVDSMQSVEGDLTTVLATLRYRLEPRLKAAGLALVWAVDELPVMLDLNPQKVLQIQKIVLEALTNVMQHAHATQVTLAAQFDAAQNAIHIHIVDDGQGFAPDADAKPEATTPQRQGHGLRNMRFRAEAIGATISFSRGLPEGTVVQLEIPLS